MSSHKVIKTIAEINERIKKGRAVVLNAEEMTEVVRRMGPEKAAREVDVVTTGTFSPMCSSGLLFNIGQPEPPKIRTTRVWMNDVPAYAGLAAVDAYLGATELPEDDPQNKVYPGQFKYGGAHVIEDLVAGRSVHLRATSYGTDCYPRRSLDRTVTLGVVGLGYVGLPLAVEKAKAGFHVIGFDVQPQKVDMVNQGHNYIGDVVDSDLKKIVEEGMLRATTDFASVASCDCVCIAVPTPLDAHQQPDISYVRSSAESIMPHMHRDMLVVLESTTYPGTTEEMLRPILEKSGLKCGVDFFLAFSPERVDPGNAIYKTKNTPKVVGGVTPECTDIAATLYEAVLEAPVHRVSSPAVAEMEKLLEDGINSIGLGPQGMGGKYSVMGVHIENTARHPSAIGVAVNVGCWSHRRGHVVFDKDLNATVTTHSGVQL